MKKFNEIDLGALAAIGLLLVLAAWSPDARWAAVYLVSSLLAVRLLYTNLYIPKLGMVYAVIWIITVWGFYLADKWPGYFYYHLIDWLCFGILALAGLNLTNQKKYGELKWIFRANQVATGICLALGFVQFYSMPDRYPVSILLYQNITAQFLGASLILQIASGSFFLIGGTLTHLYFLGCRSIMIGLVFVAMLFVIRNKRVPFKNIKAVLIQIGVGIALIVTMNLSQMGSFTKGAEFKDAPKITGKNRDVRMIRWENTVKMILDNPLGIGPGNFEWNYTRYAANDPEHRPRLNIRSPHNGYLELALEWGIPAAVVILALVGFIWIKLWPNPLSFSILTLFLFDAIFAFPMELGFPFYIVAFFVGYGMKHNIGYGIQLPKWVMVPVIVMVLSFGFRTLAAEIWEKQKTFYALKKGCELKPRDWQICLNYGVNLLKKKEYAAANKVFDDILRERPNMHPALLFNFHALKGLGDKERMGQMIWRYKQIMPEEKLNK